VPHTEIMVAVHRSLFSIQSFEKAPFTSEWNTDRTPRGGIKVMLGPSPHTFRKHLAKRKANQQYNEAMLQQFTILQKNRVPVVFSLMHLCVLSGVQWRELRAVISREHPGTDYRVFPRKKKSGGQRWICVPSVQLRAAQDWIARNILGSPGAKDMLHPAATAYCEGGSILKNAGPHGGAPWILKVDIESFFESVSERQVYWIFRRLGYAALLSFELARICTRVLPDKSNGERRRDAQKRWRQNQTDTVQGPYPKMKVGHLPQGSPTSPMLSNLVASQFDKEIERIAKGYGAIYSRYADDLILSFSDGSRSRCESVLRRVRYELGQHGFTMNRKKTRLLGPGARKIVTGLLVNEPAPRLKSDLKGHIEVALFHLENKSLVDCSSWVGSRHPLSYVDHLSGLIQFAQWVEPAFGIKMRDRLQTILAKNAEVVQLLATFGPQGKTQLIRQLGIVP
jgi:RNA-directed DNA polymerase